MARPENFRVRNIYRGKKREAFPSLRQNGKASAFTRRTPYLQGQIDGLCGHYAIINTFQCLFPGTFTDDDAWELMTILCGSIAGKFPAVIWKGAGVADTVAMFKAAENYAAATRHLKGRIVVTRPFARRRIDRVQDFWAEIGAWLNSAPQGQGKRLACIGIGYPDNHWTVVTKKSEKSVTSSIPGSSSVSRFGNSPSRKTSRRRMAACTSSTHGKPS